MGKVYDALRRAEAQRTQRSVPVPGIAASIESPLERAPGAAAADRGRLRALRRWLRRSRRAATEDATAINKRRITLLQPDSFVAEQFRTLRARLDSLASERPLRTLAMASAMPDEGKTTAAVNLALVTAMSVGRRILLVDCDLRRPKIHQALGLRPEFGLAEVLTDQCPLDRALLKVEGTSLEVLPVRITPKNPSELLASERMRALVEELARSYDQVIFDTPPTLALPDAKIVSEFTDGLVLVVRADATHQEDVQAALDILDRRRVLGVVLNGADTNPGRHGY
jgi:capsular exopolysaccharide synthesis family protein